VLEAVARLEPRWETELSDVEFAVQEVPDELSELVFDVVVEEFAEILGVDPEIIDPGYGDLD